MIDIRDENYIKTYKKLSFDDDKKEYLTNIENKVAINFDAVAKAFAKEHKMDMLKSCDALICDYNDCDKSYKFIEFKNGYFNDKDIRDKLFLSIFMLNVIEDKKVLDMNIEFELVYNADAKFYDKANKNKTTDIQVSIKRRMERETNKYNTDYVKNSNHIVKMTSIDSKAFEERERNAI